MFFKENTFCLLFQINVTFRVSL